ncbi:hypothetical protein [Desulfobotulus alkaliphilus]|uniref:hypothetical protein n=1 Tax=Desulfobotulus alkaliphilus TaxID=622671 RepID=UPI001C983A3A|nr:hypothetical protein [Desulfobotulus alkaliphilus]
MSVTEFRLPHLAYAPEIAGTMLRRQQTEAIITCRPGICGAGQEGVFSGCRPYLGRSCVPFWFRGNVNGSHVEKGAGYF